METQTKQKQPLTYTLWNYNQYKESLKDSYKHNLLRGNENKARIKRAIKELKQELKEIKKPLKTIPTKEGYKESLIIQRLNAQELNRIIIENKDSEVFKNDK